MRITIDIELSPKKENPARDAFLAGLVAMLPSFLSRLTKDHDAPEGPDVPEHPRAPSVCAHGSLVGVGFPPCSRCAERT